MTNLHEPENSPLASIALPIDRNTAAAARSTLERILELHFWTPRLLSFRITRPAAFQFSPGHYGRLGLAKQSGEVVWRPLSMVSAPTGECLEFVVALVPGGEFSQLIGAQEIGDPIWLDKACLGFLTLDQLAPGRDLWLLASGTGIGPFVSMLHSTPTWQAFRNLIVVHSVRERQELVYRNVFESLASTTDGGQARLQYLPAVTREPCPGALNARITTLVEDGRLEQAANLTFDPGYSRVMVCGNPEMARTLRAFFGNRGFQTSRRGVLGNVAFEKYW